MRCRRCEADNPQGARFCDSCGAELDRACGACGASNRAGARFCGRCGSKLESAERQAAAPASVPGYFDREGERKLVTVLFADLRGSTAMIRDLDPEQAIGRLDPGVKAMAGAVEACGGVVNRVQGDGIMALFGAPIAREDHAIRACLAADRMLAAIAALEIPDLEVRVGVNSGEVVIRATGSDATDYDAVGITVHLANRLEQSARPGTARLSALTARLARGFTDVLPLGALEFKGLDAPIEAFELLGSTERPAWEVRAAAASLTPFIGRQAELATLTAALGRAGLGRGQAVLVVADAGVGKSRLIHEFLREVPSGSFTVLRAAASSHALGSPFQVAGMLLRSWIGAEAADSGATIERRLRQALALNAGAAALDGPALRALLDLPVEDSDWPALDPARRRERMIEALRNLALREAAARPVILVVEDLHWVDDPSRVVLDALAGLGGARLLLIATTRPEHRPVWIGRSDATELRLPPLPAEQAETLLRALVGGGEDLATLRRQIVAQAEGTPLFLEEISRALLEAGLVVRDPGHFRVAQGVTIPPSVQAVVASRVDRLPPSQRSLLQVAAVIGREVSFDLLRRVAGVLEDRLRADLAGLTRAEFLYEIVLPSAVEYVFKHALTQAVAYDGMLRRLRRELHARVFAALQASAGDRIDEFTDLLAEHAWRGELWDEAASFAHRAGRRANAHSAWPEAVAAYERALEALGRLSPDAAVAGRRVEVLLAARVALLALGELARAADCLAEARALAAVSGDPVRLAHIDASRCTILTNLGALDEAIAAGRDAHASASGLADAAPLVNAVFGLGQAHWFRGEFAEAEQVLTAGLPHLRGAFRTRRTGTTGTASVLTLVCLAKTHAMTGHFDQAFALATEAKAVAADTALPYDLSYARVAEGFAHFVRGAHRAAIAELEAALAICRAAGIRLLQPSIARYLGRAYAECDRIEEAHALLDEALSYTTALSLVGLTAWCGTARGYAHLQSAASEAETVLEEAIAVARRHGYRPVAAHALRGLGAAQLKRPTPAMAEAEQSYRAAADLARGMGMRPELALSLAGLASVLRMAGRDAAADRAEAEACDIATDLGSCLSTGAGQSAAPAL